MGVTSSRSTTIVPEQRTFLVYGRVNVGSAFLVPPIG